ncbi:protein kinase [Saccharomycopsis crataegensis]|uniref:Serine/threonine-protein kinase RIO1 n=1 Tax=Saccharomycopsis crataegensis TaxID=43959 RepID=A0AAV5QKB2_9ASCO|nr:protein kinase [Saccharomycopsis crataegensis]
MEKKLGDLTLQESSKIGWEASDVDIQHLSEDSDSESEEEEEEEEEEEVKQTYREKINFSKKNQPQVPSSNHEHKNITESENGQILAKYQDKIKIDSQVKSARIEKDKSDRATVENAIDPKTFNQLQKFIRNGTLTKIDGCLSTGKEANIYYGINELTGKEFAIKVYKTSVLVFKDRERYISGEFRFKGFKNNNKINARKLIKVWSEKEFRNLKRLKLNGFNVPEPYELKSNILMMEFLSRNPVDEEESSAAAADAEKASSAVNDEAAAAESVEDAIAPLTIKSSENERGWPAPRLKDYEFKSDQQIFDIYQQILVNMRLMYQKCRLVHADLSEYNLIMYKDGEIYIIDVSQSVEPNHPMALDFLRMDIKNINDYFQKKKKIDVFLEKEIFKFVIEDFDVLVKDFGDSEGPKEVEKDNSSDYKKENQYNAEGLMKLVGNLKLKLDEEDEKQDEIFRNLHLMRDLNSLEEQDFKRFREGKIDVFKTMVVDHRANKQKIAESKEADEEEVEDEEEEDEEDNDEDDEDEEDDEEDEFEETEKTLKGKKHEDKDEKKLRKKLVKEQKQEKRKTKMKKSVKNKLIKKSKKK